MAFSVHRIKRKRRKRKEEKKTRKNRRSIDKTPLVFLEKDWKVWFERGKKDQNINNALLLRDFLHLIFF
jgi:hypothetical protein